MWEKLKALREKQAAIRAEMEGIVAKATDETRALTDEEKKAFDVAEGNFKNLGETIKRMESLPQVKDANLGNIGRDQNPGDAQNQDRPLVDRIIVPATARFRHGQLKAFSGPKAEEKAYMAGQFFAATLFGVQAAQRWCQDHGISIRAALGETDNTKGGYLVPTEMEQTIIDLRTQYGVLRRFANVVPMTSDTKDQPKRTSGLTAYWGGENALMSESEKAWGNVQLVAKKLYCLTRVSNELNEDSVISIGDDLTSEIAQAFAYAEDNAGFNGDGTVTYGGITGILNAVLAGAVATAVGGNVSFETLDLADFESALGKLAHYPGMNPAWFISKQGYYASMSRLMTAAGGNTILDIGRGPELVFLGLPVVFTQVLNSTLGTDASAVKAVVGDLKMAVALGNRKGIEVMLSDQRYMEYDQLGVRGKERVDIKVHETGTATAAGAVVVLKTAAS